MKKFLLSLSAVLLTTAAVTAADDPVQVRKALMDAVAASAGTSGAMLKGELEYNPAVAKAAIATFNGAAQAYGDFFPEGSDAGETTASPAVWENPEGFQQALAKFQSDAAAAMQAAGRQGPADLEAFRAAVMPVLSNCSACHENFRVQNN
ncbi:cytochrome c [Chelativorans sp. AA-79]|uniref:c-type cytochrome n=1 Tax=Chelativorans sp. AA-79 TaxID=3028735 RepID=UPI0023F794F0|nr:cytochrome c [Chelativorans sp. AA-79]WEX07760.1 cytochrome c [Chelativorans sp. AA-79]